VEKDEHGRCRRDGMKNKRAAEKETVRWTKKYGRETAEIDIFSPPLYEGKKPCLTRNDLSGRFE